MNKSLILAALLLPLSGYAINKEDEITKEERMAEIDETCRELIWNAMRDWMYILSTLRCIDLSKFSKEDQEWFWKKMEEFKKKMDALDKEYRDLEQS